MARKDINQKILKDAGERYIKNVAFVFWFIFAFYVILSFIFLIGWPGEKLRFVIGFAINVLGIIAVYNLDNLKKKGLVWLAALLGFDVIYSIIIGKVNYFNLIMLLFVLYGFKYYKILK